MTNTDGMVAARFYQLGFEAGVAYGRNEILLEQAAVGRSKAEAATAAQESFLAGILGATAPQGGSR